MLGSGRMAAMVTTGRRHGSGLLFQLSPGSDLSLYALDAEEPDVSEYDQLPDVAALAGAQNVPAGRLELT